MKNNILIISLLCASLLSCNKTKTENHHVHESEEQVILSEKQVASVGIDLDTIPLIMMGKNIKAHGQIAVPPSFNASVTTLIGGNIQSIKVKEGDKVCKGQVLATIIHPDIAKVQTEYIKAYNEMNYLKKEYEREQTLYGAKLSAGKTFQKAESEYRAAKAVVEGYKVQLRQLHMSPERILNGIIYDHITITAPIKGYIQEVPVHIGQYVDNGTPIFNIVDNSQLHADLMVYEKDIPYIHAGQLVKLKLTADPDNEYTGKVETIGKSFEEDPKALHIHVELDRKSNIMMPKMYLTGEIYTDPQTKTAMKDDAIIEEDGKNYIFMATTKDDHIIFNPVEIVKGETDNGYTEIKLTKDLPKGSKFVQNNAYYIIAEMKKSETSHEH